MRGQNIPLKWCQHAELLMYIERGPRSFHRGRTGLVGQKAVNFENDSNLVGVEHGSQVFGLTQAERQTLRLQL